MTTDLYLLKTRHHFSEDSVHGWHEAGEDEDGGKVPLLLRQPLQLQQPPHRAL